VISDNHSRGETHHEDEAGEGGVTIAPEVCRYCGKVLWNEALIGYGGLFSPGVFCSPRCRDLNDQIWLEWYAPQRQSIYRVYV